MPVCDVHGVIIRRTATADVNDRQRMLNYQRCTSAWQVVSDCLRLPQHSYQSYLLVDVSLDFVATLKA